VVLNPVTNVVVVDLLVLIVVLRWCYTTAAL
jgi:hypothetical protein